MVIAVVAELYDPGGARAQFPHRDFRCYTYYYPWRTRNNVPVFEFFVLQIGVPETCYLRLAVRTVTLRKKERLSLEVSW